MLTLIFPLLSGCGDNLSMEEVRRPISFSPAVSVETKTTYRDKPDHPEILIAEGNQVSLFGTRIVNEGGPGETTSQVFQDRNETLECTDVPNPVTPDVQYSSVWNYTPLAYWQQTGHYYFAGVFPGSNNIGVESDYYLTIPYLAGNNDCDLMVARAYRDVATGGTDPVMLSFNHACSAVRVLFGIDASATENSYKLTAFQMEGLVQGGTLKVSSHLQTNPQIIQSDWIVGDSRGTLFPWSAASDADRITVAKPTDVNDPDQYTQFGWHYMVPQTLGATSAIRFSVSYNNETPVTTLLNITDCDGESGADTWVPRMVYNYFITITQSGLRVIVKTTPWDEVQVTTDIITFEPS